MDITVNGIRLFYEKSGQGPALMLLHGNGEDHHIFDELAGALRGHFTIYAVDSRNHGQSARVDDFSYAAMAGDILACITELGLGRVYLLGFSDGAIISLLAAMREPEKIRGMALLGPNLKPDDFTEESHAFVREHYEATGDPLFRLMLEEPDIELDELRTVTVPTLLVGGEHDIYKPETFENIAAALPDARLKIMHGHSHDSYIVNQALLAGDCIDFFGALD